MSSGPIAVNATSTVKAIAFLTGWVDSAVASGGFRGGGDSLRTPQTPDSFRIDKDGYLPAPVKPGLGYEFDYNALHNALDHIGT